MIGRIVRFSIMAVANSSIDFWREVKVALSWLSRVDFVFASVARVQQQLRRRVKSVMYVSGWCSLRNLSHEKRLRGRELAMKYSIVSSTALEESARKAE